MGSEMCIRDSMRQRGNIIGMLRQAANDSGERFLESVDTDVVGYK